MSNIESLENLLKGALKSFYTGLVPDFLCFFDSKLLKEFLPDEDEREYAKYLAFSEISKISKKLLDDFLFQLQLIKDKKDPKFEQFKQLPMSTDSFDYGKIDTQSIEFKSLFSFQPTHYGETLMLITNGSYKKDLQNIIFCKINDYFNNDYFNSGRFENSKLKVDKISDGLFKIFESAIESNWLLSYSKKQKIISDFTLFLFKSPNSLSYDSADVLSNEVFLVLMERFNQIYLQTI